MGREHHGTNCAYRADPDEPCTCGVTERTEREMHAAWRKRAEEAETALAAMTAERDELRKACQAALDTFMGIRVGGVIATEIMLRSALARAAVEGKHETL